MPIQVRCPNGHVLRVRDQHAGKIGICPRCSAPVMIPKIGEVVAPARPPAPLPPARPADDSVLSEPSGGRPTSLSDSTLCGSSSVLLKGRLCLSCCRMVSQSFSMCPQCGTAVTPYRNFSTRREGDAIALLIAMPRIFDDPTVKDVIDEIQSAVERAEHRDIVLDLSKVTALSSLMLGKLVMLQMKLRQKNRGLTLWNVRPEVREVLAATKLDRVLRIRES